MSPIKKVSDVEWWTKLILVHFIDCCVDYNIYSTLLTYTKITIVTFTTVDLCSIFLPISAVRKDGAY